MPEPRATVVVVNWNGAHLLPTCLEALRRQTVGDFQTWVVDNASSDGSRELLARDFPEVRVLANPDNRGFAGGNNTALRQVVTPYAVLLNNDATPEPDWLERLLAPFDEPGGEQLGAVSAKVVFAPRFVRLRLRTDGFRPGGADPRELGLRFGAVLVDGDDVTERVLWESRTWGPEGVGAGRYRGSRAEGELRVPRPPRPAAERTVTVRWAGERDKQATLSWDGGEVTLPVPAAGGEQVFVLPADVPTHDVVNNVGSLVLTAGYGADRGYQEVDEGQYDEATEVFAACGCAVAFRTEAGRAVDWFDDDFFLYYEDTDLSWRLRAAGWAIRYEPKAVVRHVHAASSVEWSPVFTFHTTRNRLLMLVKDASWPRARHELVSFLVETLTMLLRALKGLVRGRRPARRPLQMRLRVLWSLARLMPRMLRRRRQVRRSARVDRQELETWLVTSR